MATIASDDIDHGAVSIKLRGWDVLIVAFQLHRDRDIRTSLTIARRLAGAWLQDRRQFLRGKLPRLCPICGYGGVMIGVGRPPRWDARCPCCGRRERHRLLWLWVTKDGLNRLAGKRILHFAPEKALRRRLRENAGYETADLNQRGVEHQVDIAGLPMENERYDAVIANHVLEQLVDDRTAMRELFRVLRPGGIALLTVPVNVSRAETYENPAITDPAERLAHFGAVDHRRSYGLDFASRLINVGFSVDTFRVPPADEVAFGLLPTESLYVATRPGGQKPGNNAGNFWQPSPRNGGQTFHQHRTAWPAIAPAVHCLISTVRLSPRDQLRCAVQAPGRRSRQQPHLSANCHSIDIASSPRGR